MAKRFPAIDDPIRRFIDRQRVFFAASAAPGARVNVSPRGTEALRVLGPNAAVYLDRTGSGNETAAHLKADGRLTLRLYGRGEVLKRGGEAYAALLPLFGTEPPGARQMVRLEIDLVQTSCGYGVPLFGYEGERDTLDQWAERKGPEGLAAYREEKNLRSIDGLPTGLLD